jgi:hypothetical protein
LADPLQSQYAVKNVLAIDEPVLAVLLDYLA